MDELNLKEIAQLMRAIEMINELDQDGRDKNGKQPAIGLNLGNGVIVEKTGNNTVSITPKDFTITDALKKYAIQTREEAKMISDHDIDSKEDKKE